MWFVIGYFTGPILAAILHAKIRGIVQMHCATTSERSSKPRTRSRSPCMVRPVITMGWKKITTGFWCGSSTKSAFTLDMIRVVCLAQAIYVAVAVTTYVPQAFAASCGPAMAEFLCLDPLWVKCTRPRHYVPASYYCDYEDASHPGGLSPWPRTSTPWCTTASCRTFKDRPKTVAAFEALKVVQCLSDTATLRTVLAGEMGEGSAGNVSKEFKERMAEKNRKLAQLSARWPKTARSPPEAPLAPRV